ncbi:hypothetical protein FKM82_010604 [Ascaphus truei]
MLSWEHFLEKYSAAKQMPEDKLLFNYNGVLYPTNICCQKTFEVMEAFDAREDDVMIASYPKCGTNWTFQLLQDMVYTIHNKQPPPFVPVLEFGSPDNFESINTLASPRIIGTHVQLDRIPKSAFKNKAKILVVLRNPKDTAVSYFHFYKTNPMFPTFDSWDEFFPHFISGKVIWGSFFDYALAWNKHADNENVLIITYEEMKEDLVAAVRKISKFFGFSLTEEQVQFIVDKGTFKNMKEKSSVTHGDIGDWKNHFSEAQSQEMDARFEECLAGTKVGEKINYNVYCK